MSPNCLLLALVRKLQRRVILAYKYSLVIGSVEYWSLMWMEVGSFLQLVLVVKRIHLLSSDINSGRSPHIKAKLIQVLILLDLFRDYFFSQFRDIYHGTHITIINLQSHSCRHLTQRSIYLIAKGRPITIDTWQERVKLLPTRIHRLQ